MPITGMNHFTILTDDVDATCTFYCELLDLDVGPRPPFNFPGAWLYKNDRAILHVIGHVIDGRSRSELHAGVFDHIAFSGTGLAETIARLDRAGIAFDLRRIAGSDDGDWQLFLRDPNGAKLEIDFDAAEPAPSSYVEKQPSGIHPTMVVTRNRASEVELAQALATAEQQLEELREQRLRSERLATLGRLAGGVGHELRNVAQLQVLALEALLHEAPTLRPDEHPALADLERTCQQVSVHAQRLLKLAHPNPEHLRPVNVADVIREVTATLGGAGKLRGITTEFAFHDQDQCVPVNKTRLEQVLFNLATNAVEAMGVGGGTLRISTHTHESGRTVVDVADTGPGIPVEALPRIFEPFFTTKQRGATGLGLAVAKEIVEGYGGQLTVSTTSNTGATFRFDLPCSPHGDQAPRSKVV